MKGLQRTAASFCYGSHLSLLVVKEFAAVSPETTDLLRNVSSPHSPLAASAPLSDWFSLHLAAVVGPTFPQLYPFTTTAYSAARRADRLGVELLGKHLILWLIPPH